MLNQYRGKCTRCGQTVAPNKGDLVRSAAGKWLVTHTGLCGQELDAKVAELRAERAALEAIYGYDVSAWLSDDYGLSIGALTYTSANYHVRTVHDYRMPERVCCSISYIGPSL